VTNLSPPAEVILGIVTANGTGTSFVEIEGALSAAGFDPDGELGIEHPKCANLFVWAGVNAMFTAALNELLGAKLVHYRPTSVLVYLADGKLLQMPQAVRPPKNGYREPHWVPAVINLGPVPSDEAA
jgi:hypothetical protein